jgi:hypothetical protein
MNKWVYFATLPVIVVCYAIVLDGTGKPGLLLAMLAGAAVIALWMRSAKATMQEREYRRTYEASRAATCTALCGVLGELEYKITMRDPSAGEFRFKSGNADRWIPRLPVECSASVQQIGDRESEVVIRGRAVPGDERWSYTPAYPEGLESRARRIFDRVGATVVTCSLIDAAAPASGGDTVVPS